MADACVACHQAALAKATGVDVAIICAGTSSAEGADRPLVEAVGGRRFLEVGRMQSFFFVLS